MIKFVIGFILGAFLEANSGISTHVKQATNTLATEVVEATEEEAKWKELYDDTVEALGEKTP